MNDEKLITGDLIEFEGRKGLVSFYYSENHITVYFPERDQESIHTRGQLKLIDYSPGRKYGLL